jgi:hypothetical protein
MHYVVRGPDGAVISLHRDPVDAGELLSPNHPDVAAFLGQQGGRSFAEMDAGLVRVIEDLVDALLRRNILRITDLPLDAQGKLFERKHFRESMQRSALSLYADGSHEMDIGAAAGEGGARLPSDQFPPELPPKDPSSV